MSDGKSEGSYRPSAPKSIEKTAELLTELAALHRRTGEVVAQLQGLPAGALQVEPVRTGEWPADFDELAYGAGLVYLGRVSSLTELSLRLRKGRSTLYESKWSGLRRALKPDKVEARNKFAEGEDDD